MPKKEKKMNIPSTQVEATETTEIAQVESQEAKQPEAPKVAEQVKVADEVKAKVSAKGAFSEADRIPANWTINPTEEGIEAFNSSTGTRFEGSIADFNAKLKG